MFTADVGLQLRNNATLHITPQHSSLSTRNATTPHAACRHAPALYRMASCRLRTLGWHLMGMPTDLLGSRLPTFKPRLPVECLSVVHFRGSGHLPKHSISHFWNMAFLEYGHLFMKDNTNQGLSPPGVSGCICFSRLTIGGPARVCFPAHH